MAKKKPQNLKARVLSNYLKENTFLVEVRAKEGMGRVFLNDDGMPFTEDKWISYSAEEYIDVSVIDALRYDERVYSACLTLPYAVAMCLAWSIKASKQGFMVDVRVRPCEISHSLSLIKMSEAKAVCL